MGQSPEDIAADKGRTGLRVDDEHVEYVGRVVLNREAVVAQDQILWCVSRTGMESEKLWGVRRGRL